MNGSKFSMYAYHGTCSIHRNSIEKNGLDPAKINERNDHWLGQGVYFFDDCEKALWWANSIASKSKGSFAIIYKAILEANYNEVLDLDNTKDLDRFLEACNTLSLSVEKDDDGQVPIFTESNFRAVYFDYYKKENNVSVIINTFSKDIAGYTAFRSTEEKKIQETICKKLGIGYKEKQICVSKKECILNVEIIYDGEEEVI